MKKLVLLVSFFLILSCTDNKTVFWCGDHACINKKEKEAYFKKTMTIEIKKIDNKDKKKYSSHEKILQQVKTVTKKKIKEDKEFSKELKLEKKARIKKEKELAKQLKLEEKARIKKEKELAKQLKLEERKKIKSEKKLAKKIGKEEKLTKKNELIKGEKNSPITFAELKEKIIKTNMFRPYPDINDAQN